jgi:hypothetical protein
MGVQQDGMFVIQTTWLLGGNITPVGVFVPG